MVEEPEVWLRRKAVQAIWKCSANTVVRRAKTERVRTMRAPDTDGRTGEARYLKADVLAALQRWQGQSNREELDRLLGELPEEDIAVVLTVVRRLLGESLDAPSAPEAEPTE